MNTVVLCLLFTSVAAQSNAHESRTIQTAQGPVRGYKEDGIFRFYGIPYATAPTGRDRFKAPLPGPNWTIPLEAVNDKLLCPQGYYPGVSDAVPGLYMHENCLIGNVLMPDTKETNLPVMVYIHGGAYQLGFGTHRQPKTLVKSNKIVAVTFNYRLGIHGFLCLGTEFAPGNAGLKDQVALLRWVKKNIANFGGNPDDVTIVGTSAGSTSVDLHMLSQASKGLFHKAIAESGDSTSVWSVQMDPIQTARKFAVVFNFTESGSINDLELFYETASYTVITAVVLEARKDMTFGFVPCVERNISGEAFLLDSPVNILKAGDYQKVPLLYGFTNMEGMNWLIMWNFWKDQINERFSDFLPADLKFDSEEEREEVAEKIKEFYFGNKTVSEDIVQAYVDYVTDVLFAYPYLRSTKLRAEGGYDSAYLYRYTFPSRPADLGDMELLDKIHGARHLAHADVVYDIMGMKENKSVSFQKVRNLLHQIWLNFITTGKPVPEGSPLGAWPPVGANRGPHVELAEEMKLEGPLLETSAHFWDSIYERYYTAPVPPNPEGNPLLRVDEYTL